MNIAPGPTIADLPPAARGARDVPLVVDLDGTLLRTDLLFESLFQLLARDPRKLLSLPGWLLSGKAAVKSRLADLVAPDPARLPVNQPLLARLRAERAAGRPVFLASASDHRLVAAVAAHLGVFTGTFGSTERVNLDGPRKAARLVAAFGRAGFDYVGDRQVDAAVWSEARGVIASNHGAGVGRMLAARFPAHESIAPRQLNPRDYLQALRVHQWAKNLLLFLPALAAHAFSLPVLGLLVLAFLAFGAVASSAYLLNDLCDLPADRAHPTKRNRPLAAGTVPIAHGVALSAGLLLAGLALGLALSPAFAATLAGYYGLTVAYSLVLKRKAIVDVMTLAGLYTVRVLAGAVAIGIPVSEWLLAFSVFFFLSLALVKRATELAPGIAATPPDLAEAQKVPGRGYYPSDGEVIRSLAAAAGFASVVIFALYVSSAPVQALYRQPQALWLVCCLLLYWVARVQLLVHRGLMHDDPVVFALRDRVSRLVLAGAVLVIVASSV